MTEISLLDFFRTGTIAGVKLGISRQEIEAYLGRPDYYYHEDRDENQILYKTSPIWIYGGIEFGFVSTESDQTNFLQEIYFKPFYLFSGQRKSGGRLETKIRRWIFRSRKGPSKQQLVEGLSKHAIPYQDTGLEMLIWDEEIKNFRVTEYRELLLQSPEWEKGINECFGTIVLRSGVQIRYDEKGEILRVSLGADWWYKGKEASITWDS